VRVLANKGCKIEHDFWSNFSFKDQLSCHPRDVAILEYFVVFEELKDVFELLEAVGVMNKCGHTQFYGAFHFNSQSLIVSYNIWRIIMAEVEERILRIKNHKGVMGLLIVDDNGKVLRTTMATSGEKDQPNPRQIASKITDLAKKARSVVRDIDP